MAGVSNFQDVVRLNSNTLTMGVEALVIGTDNANKSFAFAQDPAQASAIFLVATNPTSQATLVLPAANGTVGLVTQIEFAGTSISGGTLSFANTSGIVWGGNGSTITAALSRVSGMTINDFAGTFPLVSSTTILYNEGASSVTAGFSTGLNSAIRLGVLAPLNISYLDPGGQQQLILSGAVENGTLTYAVTLQWWAGVFTMSGSSASLVSSTSNSTLLSVATNTANNTTTVSSVNVDARFTNLAWDFTLGDYLLVLGTTMSVALTKTGGVIVGQDLSVSLNNTAFGATRAQVSYSVPYFPDGTVASSLGSYQLSQIIQSGGTSFTSVAPRIEFIGT
jgi:hypothetical protein